MKDKTESVSLDYEAECNRLRLRLNEQADEWAKRLDSIVCNKNMIIENQMKEIEFYKNIIKSILHIK